MKGHKGRIIHVLSAKYNYRSVMLQKGRVAIFQVKQFLFNVIILFICYFFPPLFNYFLIYFCRGLG